MARTTRKANTKRGSKSQKKTARKLTALSKKQKAQFFALLEGLSGDESE